MTSAAASSAVSALKTLGPQAAQLISQYGAKALPYLKTGGKGALSALKGVGKFAAQNPELTNQLLTTGLGIAAGAGGANAAQGAVQGGNIQNILGQIPPEQLQGLINALYSQNRRQNKCDPCVRLKQKKKSGAQLTEEEKRLEEDLCRACEEFCRAVDQNKELRDYQLCELLASLKSQGI